MKMYQNPVKLPATGKNNQWAEVGDPFVYRFNGRYYCYPSSNGRGIVAWESDDMVEWNCVGEVTSDPVLSHAYAPEIFYYNGVFFLITSPRGEGHYFYTSDKPTGPFQRLTNNVGLTIDGSIFADDDGSLYFLHAENPSIYAHKMEVDGRIYEGHELCGTSMGHWTEGPGMFKRGDRYYITMTGNHLLSRGYRIDYAVSEKGPMGPWIVPRNKTLLVNTDYETGSLGHSSSVIGPDLDSYWIFYHSFPVDRGGKRDGRNSRMDRILFPGDEMVVSGPSNSECPVPPRADFYAWADREEDRCRFQLDKGRILSGEALGKIGTAEITFVPGERGRALFAFRGEREYISVSCRNGRFRVILIQGEREECLLDKPLFSGFRLDVFHTLRVEFAQERTRFLVDSMTQGVTEAVDGGGCIGTQDAADTSFCAFHSQVEQSGDRLHYNNVPGTVYALLAMPDSGGEVFKGADGTQYLLLQEGESVRFRMNVEQAGKYHVQTVAWTSADAGLKWEFATGNFDTEYERMEAVKRVEAGEIELAGGMQEFTLSAEKGEFLLYCVDIFPAMSLEYGEYSGLELCHKADQIEGDISIERMEGMQMDRRGIVLSRFGKRFHANGFIEADLLFYEFDKDYPAGLFVRMSEDSSYSAQTAIGHRGYFIGFDGSEVFIWRMNFDKKEIWRQRCTILPWRDYHVKVTMVEGLINVLINGEMVASVREYNPFPYGRVGTGSFGARILVKRVAYELR